MDLTVTACLDSPVFFLPAWLISECLAYTVHYNSLFCSPTHFRCVVSVSGCVWTHYESLYKILSPAFSSGHDLQRKAWSSNPWFATISPDTVKHSATNENENMFIPSIRLREFGETLLSISAYHIWLRVTKIGT